MSSKGYFDSPIGRLCIEEDGGYISGVHVMAQDEEFLQGNSALLTEAKKQLQEYFEGRRKEFNLPLLLRGTEFQKKVWQGLCTIHYGETISYKELAGIIGNPKAVRAVGGANNKNPIMIIVPCHRVIGADGSLVGFGCGLHVKKLLLELEGNVIR